MGRRAKAPITKTLLVAAGVLFSIWIVGGVLQDGSNGTFLITFVIAAGVLYGRHAMQSKKRVGMFQAASFTIEQNVDQLVRRRAQLVRDDPYGKIQTERWTKEIDYFIAEHIGPRMPDGQQALLNRERASVAKMIFDRTELRIRERPVFGAFSNSFTPAEFELFCAEQLRLCGWTSRVTLQSRDQGVDVIGEKAGVRIVVQCKLYSNPVGNQAVQEIVAGRAHEQAHWGAVVTNNRYTPAAEQLAATNRILLLHYSDLPNLDLLLQRGWQRSNPSGSARAAIPAAEVWPCPVCKSDTIHRGVRHCGSCGTEIRWSE